MLFYRLFLYLILSIAILHRLISPFFLLLLLSPIIHTTQSPLHPRPPRPPSYSPNTTCFHLITPTKHSPSLCSAHTLPLTTFTFLFSSPIPLQDQLYPLAVYVFFSTPILLLTYIAIFQPISSSSSYPSLTPEPRKHAHSRPFRPLLTVLAASDVDKKRLMTMVANDADINKGFINGFFMQIGL